METLKQLYHNADQYMQIILFKNIYDTIWLIFHF